MSAAAASDTAGRSSTPLGLDADLLASCVSCGLCLPHCPTYRTSEEESASPRGRITLMRGVESGSLPADADFTRFMDACVMCRGCETACPSGVQFGRLMERTRVVLAADGRITPRWLRVVLRGLEHHRLLRAGTSVLAAAQRAHLLPARLAARVGLPSRLPLRPGGLRPRATSGDEVVLFTGCVMDAWQRDVHAATLRVVEAAGGRVTLAGSGADCCGALHAHAGLESRAAALAERVLRALPGDAPILVNSAGCGAQLKDVGHLLGTPAAHAFAARVLDVHEWLVVRPGGLPGATGGRRYPQPVALQDPCHLRHVQRRHDAVRAVLAPYADIVELDDEGRCCGAGGAYAVLHPNLARPIREQKLAAVARTGAAVVASANPGCSGWLAAAGLAVLHPMTIVDAVLHPADVGAVVAPSDARARDAR